MGRTLGNEDSLGKVVSDFPTVPYQHPGTHGCLPNSEENQSSEKLSSSPDPRQQDRSVLYQPGRLKIPSPQSRGPSNSLSGSEKGLVPYSLSSERSEERDSGQPFEGFTNRDRMVARFGIIQKNLRDSSRPPSGPVCDQTEQETVRLRSSEPRLGSNSYGRNDSRLGQVAFHLPVSSPQSPIKSFGQTEDVQRDSCSNSPNVAVQQLVPSHTGTEPDDPIPGCSSALSDSSGQDCLRLILDDPELKMHDFLLYALGKSFSKENVELILQDKRVSTRGQYQSVWKKWVSFVHSQQPRVINTDFCLSFLRHMHQEGRKATTIASYKSALRDPIFYGFDIDLNSDIFNRVPRACSLIRPSSPPRAITWCLGKVLDHLESIDIETAQPRQLLGKTIFLLSLAAGSRVSETVALSRDEGSIIFTNHEVVLHTDSSFLAKNEIPTSCRGPLRIPSLGEDNNSLCPVHSLRVYLARTNQFKDGALFRNCTSGKPLTASGIRVALAALKVLEPRKCTGHP